MSTAEPPVATSRLVIESDPHQTRAAVLEDGRLAEIYLERRGRAGVVGNVYKGRVSRVLPGMQAAFVDIGLERDAFLYVGDVYDELRDVAEIEAAEEGAPPLAAARRIEELLDQGAELLVQVVKAPMPNKGARVTTEITLPGRHAVLVPTLRSVGVSRRIHEPEERERLRALVTELAGEGHGVIVRTAGEGADRAAFESDLATLERRWADIEHRARAAKPPALVYEDRDLALRLVRDRFGRELDELVIEPGEDHERVLEFARSLEPELVDRIRVFSEAGLPFDHYGVEKELAKALKSRVWLKSGGYIVINPTEALVAIDVNTGRFVGGRDLEETVVRTNLEAAGEIARQIRLRDLAGILVLDFIDMVQEESRERVLAALRDALEADRARSQILDFTEFGLVQITRKRGRANLERLLTAPCPYCGGHGRVLSVSTVCLKLRRELLRRRRPDGGVRVRVHPEVERALRGEWSGVLEELTAAFSPFELEGAAGVHRGRFEILDAES